LLRPLSQSCRAVERAKKYVVCNADEGDPVAFMNRSVLESDPHKVLEGMAIAGYAVGAQQGYIYVRGEFVLAIERLKIALKQADQRGLLGTRLFGTPLDFRIDIRIGGGAYVCGEETALMASIMGERGYPRPRPPYPAESGLWGCPRCSTMSKHSLTYLASSGAARPGLRRWARSGARAPRSFRSRAR
jgi:NADH:ubiquinone oxidoreductase subunit F (NADH-binding)